MPDLSDAAADRSAYLRALETLTGTLGRPDADAKERAWAYAEFFQVRGNEQDAPLALATAVLVLDANERAEARTAASKFEQRARPEPLPLPLLWSRYVEQPVYPGGLDLPGDGLPPALFEEREVVGESRLLHAVLFLDAARKTADGWRALAREALEVLLRMFVETGRYSGEFASSPETTRLLAALARPLSGEHVVDPACGVGGSLVACIDAAPSSRVSGADLYGPSVCIAAARVALVGGDPSSIRRADALIGSPLSDADVVVMDPPFGLRLPTAHAGVLEDTTNGDVAFLQAALARLRPGGRAVVVVPAGVLSSDRAEEARAALLTGFAVDAVVALPSGTKTERTAIPRAILCLRRAEPEGDIWFVDASVVATALKDSRALRALATGVASRRGTVSLDAVRAEAQATPTSFDLVDWVDPATNRPPPQSSAEVAEKAALNAWNSVAATVADVLLPNGWYDELYHVSPAAGVSWREPIGWLLDHGASLAVRQTGARDLQHLLDAAYDAAQADIQVLPLGAVVDVSRGTRIHSEDLAPASDVPGGTPYVRVGDVQDDGVQQPDRVLVHPADSALRLRTGDLLLTLSGSVGRIARVPAVLDGAVASADIAVLRSDDVVRMDYMLALLWTVPYQRWLHGHASGATIQHLTLSTLKALPALVAAGDAQRRLIGGLRPGDGQSRIVALLSPDVQNPFALALATEPALIALSEAEPADALETLDRASHLRDRLWELALETGAVSFLRKINLTGDGDGDVREARPSSLADDPFAEWLVEAQASFARVADALGPYLGAEQVVVIDAALERLRLATRRLQQGITSMDEWVDSGPQFHDGLLFPPGQRRPSPHGFGRIEQQAVELSRVALGFVESVRAETLAALISPASTSFDLRLEPGTVEIGRPADLLLTLVNLSGFTVINATVRCCLPDPESDALDDALQEGTSLRDSGLIDLEWLDVLSASALVPGAEADGVVRLPAQTAPGLRFLKVRATFTHLDGSEHTMLSDVPLDVQGLRVTSRTTPEDFGPSPYVLGSPVIDEALFFGRRGVLARIYEQLDRPGQANLILLEGNRRSGKSSVLRRLEREATERLPGWIVANSSFQEGQGDAERPGLPTREVFYRIALNAALAIDRAGRGVTLPGAETTGLLFRTRARKALAPFFEEAGDNAADALRELLTGWLDDLDGTRLLLMLDEFDKIDEGIQSGATSPQVPEALRALFQQEPRLSAVFAVFPHVTRMRQSYWSALFGLGVPVRLGPLEPDEALDLVQQPVRGLLQYQGDAASYLIGQCGRQPYLIQTLADTVFVNRKEEARTDVGIDVVEAAARALAQNNEHLSGLWDVVGSDRRRLILYLVHRLGRDSRPPTLGVVADALEAEGIRLPEGEELGRDHLDALRELELVRMEGRSDTAATYAPATLLMGRWISSHIDPADLRARAQAEVSR